MKNCDTCIYRVNCCWTIAPQLLGGKNLTCHKNKRELLKEIRRFKRWILFHMLRIFWLEATLIPTNIIRAALLTIKRKLTNKRKTK